MPTKEVLRLIHERKIRYVMVKGIAHVPDNAVEEFRARGLVIRARLERAGFPTLRETAHLQALQKSNPLPIRPDCSARHALPAAGWNANWRTPWASPYSRYSTTEAIGYRSASLARVTDVTQARQLTIKPKSTCARLRYVA